MIYINDNKGAGSNADSESQDIDRGVNPLLDQGAECDLDEAAKQWNRILLHVENTKPGSNGKRFRRIYGVRLLQNRRITEGIGLAGLTNPQLGLPLDNEETYTFAFKL